MERDGTSVQIRALVLPHQQQNNTLQFAEFFTADDVEDS
jgi:hypothetical protein